MEKAKTLGILGGIGPLASVYFAEQIVNMTVAEKDQEHIPLFMYNHVLIPDRTDFILGKSDDDPLPYIIDGINKLKAAGCDYVAMTCNTAHFFYDKISEAVNIPVINMIDTAVDYAATKIPGMKKIGILATDGTLCSGVYKSVIEARGYICEVPDENDRARIMDIIYNQVKAGNKVDFNRFMGIIDRLRDKGCDAVILGCTELSVINKDYKLTAKDNSIIDAMQALAEKCIILCDKKIKE